MARFIALLRAVNVGGRKMPMAELREVCAALGWVKVETYIQSGNVVFAASGGPSVLESALEQAIERRFGFWSDVMIRSGEDWRALISQNPFPEASATEPSRVLAGLAKAELAPGAAAAIMSKAAVGERVEQTQAALWFHYPAGVGTSKLTASLIDRAAGSPVTARNWRTVLKLGEMVGAPPGQAS